MSAYRISTVLIWLGGLVILGIYILTLSPSIAGGDSGEIVAEGCHLGTAHPPGYPLITMLIHAISRLPVKIPIAMKINAFCAICTSLASIFMGFNIRRIFLWNEYLIDCANDNAKESDTKSTTTNNASHYMLATSGCLLSMFLCAFTPLLWQYAITAEVFALNTFFTSLIIYLTIRFTQSLNIFTLYLGAFICGLALCNQHTIILYEIPLILYLLFLIRKLVLKQFSVLIWLTLSFLVGMLPYAYLPIIFKIAPKPGSWGAFHNLSSLIHHILRKDYGTFQLFSGQVKRKIENVWERNSAYMIDMYEKQGLGVILCTATIAMIIFVYFALSNGENVTNNSNTTNANKSSAKKTIKPKIELKQDKQDPSSNADKENTEILFSKWDRKLLLLVLIFTQLFYFFVFHSLSNLPLSDLLLYGVHQRFWMQPMIILGILGGVGYNYTINWITEISANILFNKKNNNTNEAKNENNNRNNSPLQRFHSYNAIFVSFIVVLTMAYKQVNTNYAMSDQSNNYHFLNYARSIYHSLPRNSILLVNYDQQWSSLRYYTICEAQNPYYNRHNDFNIHLMHLSLMTFQWFEFSQSAFNGTNIIFPGTSLVSEQKYVSMYGKLPDPIYSNAKSKKPKFDKTKPFTLRQFLEANLPNYHIFLGGKLNYPSELDNHYDVLPLGLISEFVSMKKLPNSLEYSQLVLKSWDTVTQIMQTLPNVNKYTEETWEWTIGRDYKDRLTDTAAVMLQTAIAHEATQYQPLIDATYFLEAAIAAEGLNASASALLKNAGLAHIHLIQHPEVKKLPTLVPMKDMFGILKYVWHGDKPDSWKEWSAARFMKYWGIFLERPDAKSDGQYETIKQMYMQVKTAGKPQQQPASNNVKQEKKKSTKTHPNAK